MLINLISVPLFYHHIFSPAVINCLWGGKMFAFGGMGKTQNCNNRGFCCGKPIDIFMDRIYSPVSYVKMKWLCWGQQKREWLELHVFLWKGMHLDGSLQLKVHFYKMYGTHIHKTGYSVVENYSSVRKWPIVAKKKCGSVWTGQRSLKNSSKNSEKVLDVSGYF